MCSMSVHLMSLRIDSMLLAVVMFFDIVQDPTYVLVVHIN